MLLRYAGFSWQEIEEEKNKYPDWFSSISVASGRNILYFCSFDMVSVLWNIMNDDSSIVFHTITIIQCHRITCSNFFLRFKINKPRLSFKLLSRNIANKNMDLVKELQEISMSHYRNMVPPKIGLQSFSRVRLFSRIRITSQIHHAYMIQIMLDVAGNYKFEIWGLKTL